MTHFGRQAADSLGFCEQSAHFFWERSSAHRVCRGSLVLSSCLKLPYFGEIIRGHVRIGDAGIQRTGSQSP